MTINNQSSASNADPKTPRGPFPSFKLDYCMRRLEGKLLIVGLKTG